MAVLCAKISMCNNPFRPCKRIVSKTKRPDAHGFSKRYDKPATPLDRAAASECAGPAAVRRLTALRERTTFDGSSTPPKKTTVSFLFDGLWISHILMLD